MKIIFFLLFFSSAIAQQTVYQSFEVDSAAAPRGGNLLLNTFLQTNLRKPIAAAAKGVGGRVILSAIVELDGSVSDVKIVNSLRPDCDREAMRVFRLFKAWQPGVKGGKAVRQQITTTVLFKPNPPFIYNNGAQVSYYDSDKKVLADSSDKVRYKQEAPLDSNGLANGDIVVYKGKGGKWQGEYFIPFIRQVNRPKDPSGEPTIMIGYQNSDKLWEGEVVMLTESGAMINQSFYKNGIPATGVGVRYSSTGVIIEKKEEYEESFMTTSWYDNGQIREMQLTKKIKPLEKPIPSSVMAYWAPTGQQLVKDGNGRVAYEEKINSRSDTARQTTLVEEGLYQNGLKQGLWTGRYADGSYSYAEVYDKGICTGGKAQVAGGDTIRYTDPGNPPEFQGGMTGLGQFLQQNLRYPADAQRTGAEGRVFVSFVVCTDGTLCDYEVLKSVHPELDKEAVRVVQKMSGRWKPGVQRGQKVRVKYSLPINFSLR